MFKLAGHLGRTVSELENSLTYAELLEWQAYDAIDPIGGYRQDLQTASLLYAYYRSMGGDKSAQLSDFLPIDPMTPEERERLERERYLAELDACTARLIARLDRGG